MSSISPAVNAVTGATLRFTVDTPLDLTGYTITSEMRTPSDVLIGIFSTELVISSKTGLPGRINLSLDSTLTSELESGPGRYWFDIRLVSPGGEVVYTPKTQIVFNENVTHA